MLMGAEGVSDGDPEADDVVGVKLEVVVYKVIVRLGANEEASPRVVAQVPADVYQEMVAIDVGVATGGIIAAVEVAVEDQGLGAHSSHKISAGVVREGARVDGIGVI